MSVRQATAGILEQVKSGTSVESFMLGKEMKVVGVTFEGRQKFIDSLDSRTRIKLVREPDNPHDPNGAAIAVVKEAGDRKLGYISTKYNVPLARMMDRGDELVVRVKRSGAATGQDTKGIVIVVDKKEE